jgi:stage II sporulation protein P
MQNKDKHFYLVIGIFIMIVLILNGDSDGSVFEEDLQIHEDTFGLYEYEMQYGADIVTANASYFSLETGDDALRTIWNFPRYLWNMVFSPSEAQMQYFLRDGFAFRSHDSAEVAERISMQRDDAEEIYMLTWQPAKSNVRRSQLVHEQGNSNLIPAATYINSDEPLVYIYNSHPQEMIGSTFSDLSVGEMDVIELSHMLAMILEGHGIPSLVEDRNVVDVLRANNWNFAQSYQASRIFIEERIHQHSTLQFFFDLHRDGIPHDLARIEIDGKPYARILFVIGADNPVGYAENYAMARKLHNMLEAKRPGLSRGIVISGGDFRNGVYNQDVARTLQLIEIGTVETTTEEAINAMEVVAEVLAEYMLTYISE